MITSQWSPSCLPRTYGDQPAEESPQCCHHRHSDSGAALAAAASSTKASPGMQTQPGSWEERHLHTATHTPGWALTSSTAAAATRALTAVSYPLHPSRCTQNTNALALRAGTWQSPNFSHSAAVVLLHLQGQTSGSPEWLSSIYVQHLDNFSPVLYLRHIKVMVLHTKALRPDLKSLKTVKSLQTVHKFTVGHAKNLWCIASLIFLNNCFPSHPTLLYFSLL